MPTLCCCEHSSVHFLFLLLLLNFLFLHNLQLLLHTFICTRYIDRLDRERQADYLQDQAVVLFLNLLQLLLTFQADNKPYLFYTELSDCLVSQLEPFQRKKGMFTDEYTPSLCTDLACVFDYLFPSLQLQKTYYRIINGYINNIVSCIYFPIIE